MTILVDKRQQIYFLYISWGLISRLRLLSIGRYTKSLFVRFSVIMLKTTIGKAYQKYFYTKVYCDVANMYAARRKKNTYRLLENGYPTFSWNFTAPT